MWISKKSWMNTPRSVRVRILPGVITSLFIASLWLDSQNGSRMLSDVDIDPTKKVRIIAAVMNTPKCGTSGLTGALVESFSCTGKEHDGTGLWFKGCLNDNSVIRSHDATGVLKLIQKVREEDGYGDDAQCLIVTATRHPKPWAANLFVESRKNELCDGDFSYEWLEKEYLIS